MVDDLGSLCMSMRGRVVVTIDETMNMNMNIYLV